MLRQLVPIWFGDRAAGVLVTERDYAPIARSVRATFLPIALVLEGLLLALFVSLFPVLRRATRQLDSHMEEIEHQALHDSLTGLPNRVLFQDRIERRARAGTPHAAVARPCCSSTSTASRRSTTRSGTRAATSFCASCRPACATTLRDTDTIARLGGDEFGVVDAGRRRRGRPRRGDADPRRRRGAVRHRRARAHREDLDRRRALPRRRDGLRHARALRRRGDVRRQAEPAPGSSSTTPTSDVSSPRVPHPRERAAPRARQRATS